MNIKNLINNRLICISLLSIFIILFIILIYAIIKENNVAERFKKAAWKHDQNLDEAANKGIIPSEKFISGFDKVNKLKKKLSVKDKSIIYNDFLVAEDKKEIIHSLSALHHIHFNQKRIADKLLNILKSEKSELINGYALSCLRNYNINNNEESDRIFLELENLAKENSFEPKWAIPHTAYDINKEKSIIFNNKLYDLYRKGEITTKKDKYFVIYLQTIINKAKRN